MDLLGESALEQMNEVDYEEARRYAATIGALFKTVSAKTSKGVMELFADLGDKVEDTVGRGKVNPKELVVESNDRGRRGRCCH
jgi:hypothetical protein